jgi:hypothetical protein
LPCSSNQANARALSIHAARLPAGEWAGGDGFRLSKDDLPQQIELRRQSSDGVTTRSICSKIDTTIVNRSIPFRYTGETGAYGVGILTLTVASRLSVMAWAEPFLIVPGDWSDLDAQVTGGVEPYSCIWRPDQSLTAADIQSPRATPLYTTTYVGSVTDSIGQRGEGTVTVVVFSGQVRVTSSPPIIDPGQ